MTGRAFGISAVAAPLGLPLLNAVPTPDTGSIATSTAGTTTTPCTVDLPALAAALLCANVTTGVAPGTSTATASVGNASLLGGLTPVPAIRVSLVKATSTSSCAGASGSVSVGFLAVGGVVVIPDPTTISTPNSTLYLGVAKVVLDEQVPVAGADHGLTVNAVHITIPALGVDVVVGSATSDIHQCS